MTRRGIAHFIDRLCDYAMGLVLALLAGVAAGFAVSLIYELLRELEVV